MPPIEVVSTTDSPEAVQAANAAEVPKADQPKDDKSAPEAKATEQNDAPDSETEAEEAKEADADEDSSDEQEADEADGKTDDAEKEKPQRKSGYQKRIDKLRARETAAQARITALEAELASKGSSPTKTETKVESQTADGKPKPDDFETLTEFAEALAEWKVDQTLKDRDAKAEMAKLELEHKKVINTHKSRVETFAAEHADFHEVLENLGELKISPSLTDAIVTSELGPDMLYELAKNPEEAERIAALPVGAALKAIGKLEAKLEARLSTSSQNPKPETKKLTKAPAPIAPVGSKGTIREKTLAEVTDEMSQAEFERLRDKHSRTA